MPGEISQSECEGNNLYLSPELQQWLRTAGEKRGEKWWLLGQRTLLRITALP